ncbi:MAG: hypothetical protein GY804_12060 [Alphaproteobacteria bacterium]|nr:hypothetical protein [Alphaproteobacteria bacterium]
MLGKMTADSPAVKYFAGVEVVRDGLSDQSDPDEARTIDFVNSFIQEANELAGK